MKDPVNNKFILLSDDGIASLEKSQALDIEFFNQKLKSNLFELNTFFDWSQLKKSFIVPKPEKYTPDYQPRLRLHFKFARFLTNAIFFKEHSLSMYLNYLNTHKNLSSEWIETFLLLAREEIVNIMILRKHMDAAKLLYLVMDRELSALIKAALPGFSYSNAFYLILIFKQIAISFFEINNEVHILDSILLEKLIRAEQQHIEFFNFFLKQPNHLQQINVEKAIAPIIKKVLAASGSVNPLHHAFLMNYKLDYGMSDANFDWITTSILNMAHNYLAQSFEV